MKNIYSEGDGKEYHSKKHNHFYNKEYYLVRSKYVYETIWRKIGVGADDKILDFGCGMGQNIFLLKRQSIGFDISNFAVNFCKSKGIDATTDINKIKDNFYDIIISTEVFEHLENPFESLSMLNKKLKRGGRLIITVPRGLDYSDGKLDSNLDESQELYAWSIPTLKNLLIRTGYEPIFSKNIRAVGFRKFLLANRINFNLYLFFINLFGRIVKGGKNIMIVAKKR